MLRGAAAAAAFLSGACTGQAPVGPAVRPPVRTERLWVPQGATLIGAPDAADDLGVRGVSFSISVADAEALTTQLRDHLERGDWHARYSPPMVAVSFMNGWTQAGMGVRVPRPAGVPQVVDIREWAGAWENRTGDYLEYRLMAVRFAARPLTDIHATARYLPAAIARHSAPQQ